MQRRSPETTSALDMTSSTIISNDTDTITIPDPGDLRIGVYSLTHDRIVISLYITMGLLGIILNSWAIAVIVHRKRKKLRSSLSFQLINLAVADLIAALVMPVYLIYHILLLPFPENEVLVKILCVVGLGVFYTSPLWNAVISIERFVAIYFPLSILKYRLCHKIIVAVLVWCTGLFSTIQALLFSKVGYFKNDYDLKIPMAICYYTEMNELKRILHGFVIFKYTGPPVIAVTMYLLIGAKLSYKKRIGEKVGAEKNEKSKTQALRMVIINGIVTLVIWLPFEYICTKGYDHDKDYIVMTAIFAGLQLSNCFISPIIYYIFNESFRTGCKCVVTELVYKLLILSKESDSHVDTDSNL